MANFISSIMRELNKYNLKISLGVHEWFPVYLRKEHRSSCWVTIFCLTYTRKFLFHGCTGWDLKYRCVCVSETLENTVSPSFKHKIGNLMWVLVASTFLLIPGSGFLWGPHEGRHGIKSLLLQFGEPFYYWLFCIIVFGHSYLYSMTLTSSHFGILPLSWESSSSKK